MIPLVPRFVAAHGIVEVTVIADAGMMSEANLADIEDAGWSFVIGGNLPEVPYAIKQEVVKSAVVRHEALMFRMEVRDLRRLAVVAVG